MLEMYPQKGSLEADADADLCVLSEVEFIDQTGTTIRQLKVDQVWKFGKKIFESS